MSIDEGGGSNSYIGDIGAIFINSWNPASFVGEWIYDYEILDAAIADSLEFSHILEGLPSDDIISGPVSSWGTVKQGLNVLNIIEDSIFSDCYLPQTIIGETEDTVVVNVLCSGEIHGGIQVGGGLLPEKLIVNYVNASEVYLGLGSRISSGTYLVKSGNVLYGAGSGGINGAVISVNDILIGGGGNLFVHCPFDPSAIPEPGTILLVGLGAVMVRRRR